MATAVEIAKKIGIGAATSAKVAGGVVKDVLGKVDPDVWREFAHVTVQSYSLFLPRREEIEDRGPDGFSPVVLVHGLGGNRGTWTPLRMFLRLMGHRRMFAFGYEDGTIEAHAANLKEFILKVMEKTGTTQVDLVAHSLGGVIARYAIQRLSMSDAVRTLITLASPNQGTYAARYANTRLTVPLRPESRLLRDLNQDDLRKLPTKFIALFSDRDVYVVPKEMMTHPDAENHFIPNLSHNQHLHSPSVFRLVATKLEPLE